MRGCAGPRVSATWRVRCGAAAGKSSLLAILSQQPQLLPKKAAPRGRVGVTWADDIVQAQTVTPEASKDSLPNPHPTPMTGFDIMQLAPAAPHNGKTRKATLGFVQQHDCLMPTLTVTETVLLGMMFREYVKGKDIEDAGTFVYALLKDLGLLGAPPAAPVAFAPRRRIASGVHCQPAHVRAARAHQLLHLGPCDSCLEGPQSIMGSCDHAQPEVPMSAGRL